MGRAGVATIQDQTALDRAVGSGAKMESVDMAPAAARGIERARWGNLARLVATVFLVGLHSALILLAFTHSPVDVDEGLNLSVVANIVNGVGYTSDGVYAVAAPHNFESSVTTGPTLVLPAAALHAVGIDTVVAGRVVGVVAYLALTAGLYVLGRRIAGPWAGLASAASPLLIDVFTNDSSPIYGPGDLLGEYCVAAFITWALVVVGRRPVTGFLLLGLAILTKVIAVFATPALVFAFLAMRVGRGTPIRVRTWFALATGLAGPTALFELAKIAVVGPRDYVDVVHGFWSKAGANPRPTHMMAEKLASLLGAWFVPALIAFVVALGASVVMALAAALAVTESPRTRAKFLTARSEPVALSVGALGVALGIVGAWMWLRSTDPLWLRHPSPGLVVGAAGVIAALVGATRWLAARPDPLWRRLGFLTSTAMTVLIAYAAIVHVADAGVAQRLGTLGEQRDIAAAIDATGTRTVQGIWGPMVPLAVMADKPAHSIALGVDPNALLVFDIYPRAHLADVGHSLAVAICGDVVLQSDVILCWPAPDAQAQFDALVAQTSNGDLSQMPYELQPSPSRP